MRPVQLVVAILVAGLPLGGRGEPAFTLHDPGTEDIVDYDRYGAFTNIGQRNFEYYIFDREGLAAASGEGVDPSTSITNNPAYQKAKADKKLGRGNHWKHVGTSDPQMDYFVWNDATEDPGTRLLYVGKALENGGHYIHALKAYRSAMILYPDSACWSAGGEFQWDIATAAWNAIINLLRDHPELNLRLVGADVTMRGEESGLAICVTPGRLERIPTNPPAEEVEGEAGEEIEEAVVEGGPVLTDPDAIIQHRGTGTVQLVQYGDGRWEMLVAGEPYFIRGMNYAPTRIGTVPWEWNWLWGDDNTNGIVDCLEVWLDANSNGRQDDDEPTVNDAQLLEDMGCNTIKLYITASRELDGFNHLVLRRMYREHGIRVVVGNFLGAYCNDSGANWDPGTDYTIRRQREAMKAAVSNMVMKLKDEPWVLAWILGNENNMEMSGEVNATRTNASKYPETYTRFLNEVCKMVHELDPNHPIGVGNLLTGLVEYYGRLAPELDYIGINSYLGEEGFGATWQKVRGKMNRPVVITEFGCDSYYTGRGPDEEGQSRYLLRNWEDIVYNSAGHPGAGNAIGGFVFEWLDEWWKDTFNYFEDSMEHQTARPIFPMPFPDGQAQEEWFGVMSQGAGNQSPYQRVAKQAYFDLREVWTQEENDVAGKEDVSAE